VTLTGPTSPQLGVSVTKMFSVDLQHGAFVIEYRLTNHNQATVNMAPWEVTHVFPGGVTFFPTGTRIARSMGATLPTTDSGGITWLTTTRPR
jgi:hypothetical protein